MYRHFWLKDIPQDPEDTAHISHVLCSNGLYYGSSSLNLALPNLTKLLTKFDGVLIEPQGLTYHGMAPVYGKGIIIMKKAGDLLHISEIGLEHPGLQIHQIKKFPGLHFRVDDFGTWHRTSHLEDCDCGHDHNDHLRLLGRVDEGLSDGRIAQQEENIYAELGVDPQSDLAAIAQDLG
jgi:hypothetical protein